ncbi:MAG: hypothetical protein ACYTHM_10210 [Planctomycetota bacterium]
MTETTSEKMSTLSKIKTGAFIGGGVVLLWFLVVNLVTTCELSLWPFSSRIPIPGTLFMFIFLLVGFSAGFGLCFWWLRRDRLDAAVTMLTEQDRQKEGAREAGGTGPEGPAGEGKEG